jgi:5-methylcytosine-specific restriction protein B
MSLDVLVDLVHQGAAAPWEAANQQWFDGLFGAASGRYAEKARNDVQLRSPEMKDDKGVSYAAIIHKDNPRSGRYRGTSFVVFPAKEGPCLAGLVVGTDGLSPDESILGRPGHARKARAIASWLNAQYGHGERVAWAKQDPTRTDEELPGDLLNDWPEHWDALKRYGKEVYLLFRPTADRAATHAAVASCIDLLFAERGHQPLAKYKDQAKAMEAAWFDHLMPGVEESTVASLLGRRRFVILQGPPGTGKTRLAVNLLRGAYQGHGQSIQVHANTTYESFVGGLARSTRAMRWACASHPNPAF